MLLPLACLAKRAYPWPTAGLAQADCVWFPKRCKDAGACGCGESDGASAAASPANPAGCAPCQRGPTLPAGCHAGPGPHQIGQGHHQCTRGASMVRPYPVLPPAYMRHTHATSLVNLLSPVITPILTPILTPVQSHYEFYNWHIHVTCISFKPHQHVTNIQKCHQCIRGAIIVRYCITPVFIPVINPFFTRVTNVPAADTHILTPRAMSCKCYHPALCKASHHQCRRGAYMPAHDSDSTFCQGRQVSCQEHASEALVH